MKTIRIFLTIAMLGAFSFAFSQDLAKQADAKAVTEKNSNAPIARFDKTIFDFGEIIQNSPGTATFTLTNDGKEPLIISSATASCGCTNLSYSKDPVLPKNSVEISVTYNAAALGNFTKTVTVRTNAGDQPVILQVKGKVVAKS
jgi:hypothetical protein